MKQKFGKWERWLQVIYDDMVNQATSSTLFRETVEIIVGNPQIPKNSDFWDFLEKWYVDSTVMGLRRQYSSQPAADRFVAHRDRRGLCTVPTHAELDEALSFAERLLQKYYLLLRGDSLVSVSAKLLLPWKRVFEMPWAPPPGPANKGHQPPARADRKSTRLNSSHIQKSRMPSSA